MACFCHSDSMLLNFFSEEAWLQSCLCTSVSDVHLSRFGICCSASVVIHDPHEPHLAVKRILGYVKGTLDTGLHIDAVPVQSLTAYYDANWAGHLDSRRSTSGYCIFLGDNLVSWSYKR